MLHTFYQIEARKNDGLLIVRLRGEIDHHNAMSLRRELDDMIMRERPRRLLVDLAAVEFMDSAGLGLLMGRLRLMREIGGTMALLRPHARIIKILRLAGMERFMEIDGITRKGEM